ncbi:hypothetical protein CES86_4399 [Brucella lupini]|uniref:Uncharacterized protein n=1 Tax=Brucella lupini TaxID=255457 RepID=A0A256GCZ8_9HYPH|nr:hypothetical protein CES86_4399 [Brucella lupini]
MGRPIRSFAGGGASLRRSENSRSCLDRQRSDRSAAMRTLQCTMKRVLILLPPSGFPVVFALSS